MKTALPLGESTDIEVADRLLSLKNKTVLDVGCGSGRIAGLMAELGATVTGIEPYPKQAEENRQADPVSGVELIEAGAESLPLDSGSFDAALFCYSLHHIPARIYEAVFREIARVLKPEGKMLVLEPIAEGSSQYVMALYHDETEARQRAQDALECKTLPFNREQSYRYNVLRSYADFDAYYARYGKLTYNTYEADRVRQSDVRARFMEYQQADGVVRLDQPTRADLFILK